MSREFRPIGIYADVTDAPSPIDPKRTVKLGVRSSTFRVYWQRRLTTAIAQYYGIVQDRMASAKHLFQGLRRPLMLEADENADQAVLVYTWRPLYDVIWGGSPFDGSPIILKVLPRRVF